MFPPRVKTSLDLPLLYLFSPGFSVKQKTIEMKSTKRGNYDGDAKAPWRNLPDAMCSPVFAAKHATILFGFVVGAGRLLII